MLFNGLSGQQILDGGASFFSSPQLQQSYLLWSGLSASLMITHAEAGVACLAQTRRIALRLVGGRLAVLAALPMLFAAARASLELQAMAAALVQQQAS